MADAALFEVSAVDAALISKHQSLVSSWTLPAYGLHQIDKKTTRTMSVPSDPNVFPLIPTPADFETGLAQILKEHESAYIWFFGSETEGGSQSKNVLLKCLADLRCPCLVLFHPRFVSRWNVVSKHFPAITANYQTANEQSWCLECATSDPWIIAAARQVTAAGHPVTLVQARVGPLNAWEDKEHPYRTLTKSVPAILKYVRGKEGPQTRLDKYSQLTDLPTLKEFFSS